MKLLPRDSLLRTNPLDKADWNYRPLLGFLQRSRFRILLSLLRGQHYPRLLEVGYGSGVLFPELIRVCHELWGIDTHRMHEEVKDVVRQFGIQANLTSGSIESTSFPSHFFDCCVAVSVLEYVEDLDSACTELRRILKPRGILALVTPGNSRLIDLGLRLLTGTDPKTEYGERRSALVSGLLRHFSLVRSRGFPRFAPRGIRVYLGLELLNHLDAPGDSWPG